MTQEEIKKVLEKHRHWLEEDCEGWEEMRANLRGANLRYADLYDADLRDADLRDADLRDADLRDADLYDADLRGANLRYADLYGANLRGANLRGANLCDADLYDADLRDADLRDADLRDADLYDADLRDADLRDADLYGANLRYADLYGANLRGVKSVPFIPYACPDFGIFIGWKKAYVNHEPVIVQLEIPEDAKRLSATGRKCKCDKAKVLSIKSMDGNTEHETACSKHDHDFIYKVGEVVSVENFDECRWNECSTGIHFFINKQEAVEY